jgi:hypothetical protein
LTGGRAPLPSRAVGEAESSFRADSPRPAFPQVGSLASPLGAAATFSPFAWRTDSEPSMWLWVSLAWVIAAGVAAALHRRWRVVAAEPTPELAAFVLRFENQLTVAHADVAFLGLLPDRFACLLRVDGQETVVSLHQLYRHAEAHPDAFPQAVATLVAEIREIGLDRVGDLDFAAAAPLLLPQVRPREWLTTQGTFGDSGLAHTPLNDELVVVYVLDDRANMTFVCREHLRRWRKDVVDLHNLALANLARRGSSVPDAATHEALVLQSGDGFDAARVLLLARQHEGLLVAIPDRDTLWVGPEAGQDLGKLMATTEAIAEHAAHPVSGRVYRLTDGRLAPVPTRR